MIVTKIHLIGLADNEDRCPERVGPTSCAGCGMCCEVLSHVCVGDDELYVPADMYGRNDAGELVMNKRDDGSCAALNLKTRECDIYEDRPSVCREFPIGCGKCLMIREDAGFADEYANSGR